MCKEMQTVLSFRPLVKRLLVVGAAAALALSAMPAFASQGTTGNGGPSGPHYTLNIHGVANGEGFNGNNQNDIFVPLKGNCKINLTEGPFQVLQPDCVNNPSAEFQLPNPDPTNSGTTVYSVYARALGTPGGSSKTQTCFTDSTGTFCSQYTMELSRNFGQNKFTNVSQDLLYVYYCSPTTDTIVRVPLFSDSTAQYYWSYTNDGLRLAQLRFYPGVQTTVEPASGDACTPAPQ
jgi:hypothetical protein